MTNSESEASIRTLIEARAEGVRSGDVEKMVVGVADDIVAFDVVEPLRHRGGALSRERAAEWVASFGGSIGWESENVQITVDGDVAFSQALNRVSGKLKSGAEVDMWFRTTLGFRRISGRWLILHEHSSAPFDPRTGQASLGLKP